MSFSFKIYFSELKEILKTAYNEYLKQTYGQRKTRTIDTFLVFFLFTAAIQFIYRLIAGSFPFNSFLSGLLCSIGMFVLTLNLRLQICKPDDFEKISPYRAFSDYIVCCLVLFAVTINFIG